MMSRLFPRMYFQFENQNYIKISKLALKSIETAYTTLY